MNRTFLTAALALTLTIAPAATATAALVETAPRPAAVECDTALERPAVWDPITGEVILCESRGEGPAMGPDCELLGDCPPQLPMPPALPAETVEPAPPAATEPLTPVVHDELPETGLTPDGVLLVAFALAAICLGCVIVAGPAWTRWRRRRRVLTAASEAARGQAAIDAIERAVVERRARYRRRT